MINFLVSLILILPSALLRGVVLRSLWLWFFVPLGAHPIGIAQAIGMSATIGLVTHRWLKETFDEDDGAPLEKTFSRFFGGVLLNLWVWGMGAIVAWFMV